MVADGFRALLAAICIDQNLKTAQSFARDFLLPILKNVDITEFLHLQYPRHALRRILSNAKLPAPEFKYAAFDPRILIRRISSETGRKTHLPTFVIQVYSGDTLLGEGAGFSLDMAKGEVVDHPICIFPLFQAVFRPCLSSWHVRKKSWIHCAPI